MEQRYYKVWPAKRQPVIGFPEYIIRKLFVFWPDFTTENIELFEVQGRERHSVSSQDIMHFAYNGVVLQEDSFKLI